MSIDLTGTYLDYPDALKLKAQAIIYALVTHAEGGARKNRMRLLLTKY